MGIIRQHDVKLTGRTSDIELLQDLLGDFRVAALLHHILSLGGYRYNCTSFERWDQSDSKDIPYCPGFIQFQAGYDLDQQRELLNILTGCGIITNITGQWKPKFDPDDPEEERTWDWEDYERGDIMSIEMRVNLSVLKSHFDFYFKWYPGRKPYCLWSSDSKNEKWQFSRVSKVPGYIYVLKDPCHNLLSREVTLYKIGSTRNWGQRIRTLMRKYPRSYPIALMECSDISKEERYWHSHYDHYWMYGEWYELPKGAVQEIGHNLNYKCSDSLKQQLMAEEYYSSFERFLCD